jgi:hypothetical protein
MRRSGCARPSSAWPEQQRALDEMLVRLGDGVGSAEQQIRALAAAMAENGRHAGKLVGATGPELIDALMRVREAAAQAAERAREAIAAVIPDSAAQLGEASRKAISDAVDGAVASSSANWNCSPSGRWTPRAGPPNGSPGRC